jgi:hypothetical protein
VSAALPIEAFKKNGTLHLRNCATFYGVRPHTLRVWYRSGAPVLKPDDMVAWKAERNRARLKKIGEKNNRYGSKQAEIIRLYVQERLGLRAISAYFGRRPSTAGVRNILDAAGVYRHGEAMTQQAAASAGRRQILLETEKERRRRVVTCVWRLRRGQPIETTCREHGWNPKSVWAGVRGHASYSRLKTRRSRTWPDKRKHGFYYSHAFPKEALLQARIEELLSATNIQYVRECRLQRCRTRVDFKLEDETFLECKVGMNSGQTYEFIGQACHYRLFAKRVLLCIPSDVRIRADLFEVIIAQGVTVCDENTVLSVLKGNPISNLAGRITFPQTTSFKCKCCGSAERRRHRMNRYCVDCAPNISAMRFDYRLNRWVNEKDYGLIDAGPALEAGPLGRATNER